MFGWLRRRIDAEHCRLIFQNCEAARDSELRLYILFNGNDPEPLESLAVESEAHRAKLRSGNRLSNTDVERALAINMDLRRLHDHNHRTGRESFDSVYCPLGGWKFWHERNGYIP